MFGHLHWECSIFLDGRLHWKTSWMDSPIGRLPLWCGVLHWESSVVDWASPLGDYPLCGHLHWEIPVVGWVSPLGTTLLCGQPWPGVCLLCLAALMKDPFGIPLSAGQRAHRLVDISGCPLCLAALMKDPFGIPHGQANVRTVFVNTSGCSFEMPIATFGG